MEDLRLRRAGDRTTDGRPSHEGPLVAAAVALGFLLLLVPDAQVAPTAISLVAVDETTAVDFGDGVVVVLALGSDSRTEDPLEGNADAIELIAIDFETGDAAAVGDSARHAGRAWTATRRRRSTPASWWATRT